MAPAVLVLFANVPFSGEGPEVLARSFHQHGPSIDSGHRCVTVHVATDVCATATRISAASSGCVGS